MSTKTQQMPLPSGKLTQKDLQARWGVCLRTVQREVRRWKLLPYDFIGIQPVFDEASVDRMELKRREARLKATRPEAETERLLEVKEARAAARKRGGSK